MSVAAAGVLLDTRVAHAEDWIPTFTQIGSLSLGRSDLASAAINGKVVFAGGITINATPQVSVNNVDIYDIASNSWTTTALSDARDDLAAAAAGNKILFAGGSDFQAGTVTNRVDLYDTVSNTWSTAALSVPRAELAATAVGSKIIFAGGRTTGGVASNAVDIYDSATNTWSSTTVPLARFGMSATTIGNKALFIDGWNADTGFTPHTVDTYDAATNSWSTLTFANGSPRNPAVTNDGTKVWINAGQTWRWHTPGSMTEQTGFTLNKVQNPEIGLNVQGKMIFAGGFDMDGSNDYGIIGVYNPDLPFSNWTNLRLPVEMRWLTALSYDNRGYFAGGAPYGIGAQPPDNANAYRLHPQYYTSITSTQNFTLTEHGKVTGRVQLDGGSLTIAGRVLYMGSLAGSAPINFVSGGGTGWSPRIYVGTDNTNSNYSGDFGGASSAWLIKVGAGTLTLDGPMDASGIWDIRAGTLAVGPNARILSLVDVEPGAALTIAAGGILNNHGAGSLNVRTGATLSVAPGATIGGSVSLDNGINLELGAAHLTSGAQIGIATGAALFAANGATFNSVFASGRLGVADTAAARAPGILNLTTLTLAPNSDIDFDLGLGTLGDKISMPTGTLTVTGLQWSDFNFNLISGGAPGDTFILVDAGTITGNFGAVITGTLNGNQAHLVKNGNDLAVFVVPEPSSMFAGAFAVATALLRRRSR
jgi:hypothetical protein